MTTQDHAAFDCCPPFDPGLWDDKMVEWNKKRFIREKVFTFFYMPLNFGRVMRNLDRKLREAGAEMVD